MRKKKTSPISEYYQTALRDHEWIAANGIELHQKYRGEWIAVGNGQLLSHGYDFDTVALTARKLYPKPVFMQIPREDTVIYRNPL